MANRSTSHTRGRGLTPFRVGLAGLLSLLVLLTVAGCSGGSGPTLPSVTAKPTRTGSAAPSGLPSVTGPTAQPSRTRDSATESRTSQPSTSASQEQTPEQSTEQSQAAPTVVVSVQSSDQVASATPSATAASAATDDGSSWGWLLLLLALVVAGVAIALWRRRSARRRDERTSFEAAVSEASWLGRDLVPALLADSRDERRGAWTVSRPRVLALEDRLAQLATPGSETTGSLNAQHLETAVIGIRQALDAETLPDAPSSPAAAEAMGALKQAALQLDHALSALAPATAHH